MFKDRQQGLVYLHGCTLAITAVVLFLTWGGFVNAVGWIEFSKHVNRDLYLLATVCAGLWVQQGLRGYSEKLGCLGWGDAIRLSRQQIGRIAIVLFAVVVVTKDGNISRTFLIGYLGVLAGALIIANKYFPPLIARLFFGARGMRTVVIAPAKEVEGFVKWLRQRPHLAGGIEVIGWIGDADAPAETTLPRLGTKRDVRRVLIEHDATQILVSQANLTAEAADTVSEIAEQLGCRVRFFSNVQQFFGERAVRVEHEENYTFVTRSDEPLDHPLNQIQKRLLDIVVALPVVVLIFPPLMLMVWCMQRIQSPGPLFHCQLRSGLNRRKFLIFKFRTMNVNHGQESRQAGKNDARIYPFGRFLRRASLDEIPQFLNVLLGDMSVSGPRPHLLEHDEQFAKVVNFYHARHFVKPGITGLAQSKGFRGEISEPSLLRKRIGYDMLYIKRWSLSLDLQIMAATVRHVFFPPSSAY
ncbi:exopolysaccharide biosynthesis polyprenyl glycosylphosphotransferase [Horticoccus luteus]|uniref:Exopolysaccharide biosynthesis polyprenyl glycosylphosphotransferase n=1 Tax=Horticoccus luteus TaxID=2862869 RepID=A0A8F9TWF0_9BACT|nr:exopolysaccharide biosynthesis polyprenyl glycosylphosphotransferase [Horticoccus luteus]QYM80356.1 exopolysaccharide biosynthesis polyprenyl glycosylphosphotransferase [Horticoccus luteus]